MKANGGRMLEPLWWVLFSAGGLCVAMIVPPLILWLGFAPALDWLPREAFDHARVSRLVYHPAGLLWLVMAIVLPVFHAAYRIRHSLHDLQLGRDAIVKSLCFGGAVLAAGFVLALWWMGHRDGAMLLDVRPRVDQELPPSSR